MASPAMQVMEGVSGLTIKEKVSLVEAATALLGQEVEMANKYSILDAGTGEQIFYAVEQTDCITRQVKQCCGDCAPWSVDILLTKKGHQQKAFHMERPFTCTCCCFNRPVVEISDTSGRSIGRVVDPCTCCAMTFHVHDAQGNDVVTADGGCCQWGICCPLPCGPCSKIDFDVLTRGRKVGHLQKKVPGCCKFFFASDADNYHVDFGAVRDPYHKVLIMALAIFMDFRYFNNNSADDDGGVLGLLGGGEE